MTYVDAFDKVKEYGCGEVQQIGYYKPHIPWLTLEFARDDDEVKLMFERGKKFGWLKVYIQTDMRIKENREYDHANYVYSNEEVGDEFGEASMENEVQGQCTIEKGIQKEQFMYEEQCTMDKRTSNDAISDSNEECSDAIELNNAIQEDESEDSKADGECLDDEEFCLLGKIR
ncbi:hypothetical protein JCGZ_26941 [Jatropha curcas]|uniref:Uncharacterized protein n=1 Tax=Jatropha curcas TaxID=180498 RepID=A0A067L3V8_JATCU|nr:uncharacterized protein LOC105630272 [Jatropha curcas]KDP41923.1 hypothetical protein JCGZ_26941 [Jatropha curcas]